MDKLKNYARFDDHFKKIYNETPLELLKLDGVAPEQLDVSNMSHMYFSQHVTDISIDDNANHLQDGRSYGNYFAEMAKSNLKIIGYHALYDIMCTTHGQEKAGNAIKAAWMGDLYVHDSTAIQIPYCWAASMDFLLYKGNYWGQLRSYPPKRPRSFIDQVKEVTIELAQEIAGAVALGDIFVAYAYLVKSNNMDINDVQVRKQVENDFQSLVHTLNKKLRPSHQSPFTNISIFDRPNLEILFADVVHPDGSKPDFDLIEEIQRIFCDWFHKGDPHTGLPYRFPVVTLNLRVDDNGEVVDKKALDYFSEINLNHGGFNIYISSGNKIASCCRLTNDLDLAGTDSFGNGGISLGSHRVVTVNLARIGHVAQSFDEALSMIQHRLEQARDILVAHRQLLKNRAAEGFLPFFQRGIMDIKRFFSTFGISGVYECLEGLGFSIHTEQGQARAQEILQLIKTYATQCSKETGDSFNIEQVPAESLAVKFAAKDAFLHDMDYALYSNQFVPLWVHCDIVDRIKIDGSFSKTLTGGGISHLNLGERLTSKEQMKRLINYAAQCNCEHFAINYNFAQCVNNHTTIAGTSSRCPICGDEIKDYYTRIIGYFTPVSAWNKTRRKEHKQRDFKENAVQQMVRLNQQIKQVKPQSKKTEDLHGQR